MLGRSAKHAGEGGDLVGLVAALAGANHEFEPVDQPQPLPVGQVVPRPAGQFLQASREAFVATAGGGAALAGIERVKLP